MDLLKRYASLRRERATVQRELDELTARYHASRGEGLVQTLVRCSEDIEVVRVCDAQLAFLRSPELMIDIVRKVSTASTYTSGGTVMKLRPEWSWFQEPQFVADSTA